MDSSLGYMELIDYVVFYDVSSASQQNNKGNYIPESIYAQTERLSA